MQCTIKHVIHICILSFPVYHLYCLSSYRICGMYCNVVYETFYRACSKQHFSIVISTAYLSSYITVIIFSTCKFKYHTLFTSIGTCRFKYHISLISIAHISYISTCTYTQVLLTPFISIAHLHTHTHTYIQQKHIDSGFTHKSYLFSTSTYMIDIFYSRFISMAYFNIYGRHALIHNSYP